MKSVSNLNGLQELRTVTTQRLRATPPNRATPYLNTYLLSMARLRMDQELALLQKRRQRLLNHRGELIEQLGQLHEQARSEIAADAINGAAPPPGPKAGGLEQRRRPWKTVAVGY